ncbi:MAG: O-antigen ligase family protein [Acidimicrobiales bacterium]
MTAALKPATVPAAAGLLALPGFAVLGLLTAYEPVMAVGLAGGIGLLVIWYLRPAVGLAVWSVSFFIPYSILGNLLLKGGFVVAVAVTGLHLVAEPASAVAGVRDYRWPVVTVGALLAWLAATVLWAADPMAAVAELAVWLLTAGVFAVTLATTRTVASIETVLWGVMAGGGLAAATALFPIGGPVGSLDGTVLRSGGAAGDPNILAAGLVAVLALCPGMWGVARSASGRWAAVLVGALCLGGIIASASRGALVAAGCALAVTVLLSAHPGRLIAGLAVPVAALIATWATFWSTSWSRVTDFGGGGTGRTELWRAAWEVWGHRPVTGVGVGNLIVVERSVALELGSLSHADLIAERPLVAHNTTLQFLSETGIIGLALFVAVVAVSVGAARDAAVRFHHHGRPDLARMANALIAAIAGLIGASLFLSMGREYRVWLLLACGPALAHIARTMNPGRPAPVSLSVPVSSPTGDETPRARTERPVRR